MRTSLALVVAATALATAHGARADGLERWLARGDRALWVLAVDALDESLLGRHDREGEPIAPHLSALRARAVRFQHVFAASIPLDEPPRGERDRWMHLPVDLDDPPSEALLAEVDPTPWQGADRSRTLEALASTRWARARSLLQLRRAGRAARSPSAPDRDWLALAELRRADDAVSAIVSEFDETPGAALLVTRTQAGVAAGWDPLARRSPLWLILPEGEGGMRDGVFEMGAVVSALAEGRAPGPHSGPRWTRFADGRWLRDDAPLVLRGGDGRLALFASGVDPHERDDLAPMQPAALDSLRAVARAELLGTRPTLVLDFDGAACPRLRVVGVAMDDVESLQGCRVEPSGDALFVVAEADAATARLRFASSARIPRLQGAGAFLLVELGAGPPLPFGSQFSLDLSRPHALRALEAPLGPREAPLRVTIETDGP